MTMTMTMTMIRSERIKHIPSFSWTDQNNPPEKISKESPAGKGGTITQGYLQLVMLLGAIIARSSLSIYRSSHLTWLDEVRQANTITYPPLSSSPLHKHTPPTPHVFWPFVERPDIAALLPLTVHRLLAELSQGGTRRLLASLNQVDLSLNNTYFLLKTPPLLRSPMLISNRLENGNSQRDKTCRLLFSQDSFSAKLTSLPNGASCLCAATTAVFATTSLLPTNAVFATAGCVFKSLLYLVFMC